ncbi:hypothetical protein RFI_30271 [Reticulomyxa filosa]|uniref:Uncharacterized protein n=1 Tax=Reticulomyxa filosa TaxID=46433 RepID=X6M128_RETFI|nr:hypothetical protein RFI_30271 [Reticulomyxa filosa]|eukprot:ETO07122.1 hypothetical protein RFI_30271 [Reticulomyxa filosa]
MYGICKFCFCGILMEKYVQLWMLVKQCHLCDQNIDSNAEWTFGFIDKCLKCLPLEKKVKSTSETPILTKCLRRIRCVNECQSNNSTLELILHDFCQKNNNATICCKGNEKVLKKCQEYLKQLTTNPSYRYDNSQLFRHIENETVILESRCLYLLHVF